MLTERLGAGAITEAFVAMSFGAEGFEKEVVVKCVHERLAAIPRFTDGFIEETKGASALSHSNVVQLVDVGRDARGEGEAPVYFVVTERVRGIDLSTLIERARTKDTPLPTRLVLHIVAEVAKALDHAHRRRKGAIVHGGLSPANVLVSTSGEVKLSDFGVHRALAAAHFAPHETRALPYRSPEELRGEPVTPGADLFALGALAVELSLLRPLFLADSPEATRARVLDPERLDAVDVVTKVDPDVLELARKLLGPLEERPPASDVHEELVAWAYRTGDSGPTAEELARFVSRVAKDGGPAVKQDDPSLVGDPAASERAFADADPEKTTATTAHVRLVTFVAAAHDEGLTTSDELLALLRERGATEVSRDSAEVRVVFGLKDADGRDIAQAIDAALDAVARWPRLGVGLDLGSIVVDERGELVGTAELVPRFRGAAALAASERGKVLVTGGLARIAVSEFEIDARAATSLERGASRVTMRRSRPLLGGRFVGRRRELADLGRLFDLAASGKPQVVLLRGDAGSGKTRLSLELERRALRADPETRTEVVSLRADDGSPDTAFAVAERLARGESAARCLIVVDNCEYASREVALKLIDIEELAAKSSARVIVVFSGRAHPEALTANESGARPARTEITLGPLAAGDVAELAAGLLGARVLPPELLELVTDYSHGVPMFVEHLVRELAESALVSVRGGVAKAEVSRASVPRVPRAWLESSLARLDADARKVVRALSILEGPTAIEAVAEVAGLSKPQVLEAAESLVPSLASFDRGIGGRTPELARAVREVARDGIPPGERKLLHLTCARVLASRPNPSPAELERIAAHHTEGGDGEGALERWALAARSHTNAGARARCAAHLLALADPSISAPVAIEASLLAEAIAMLAAAASRGLRSMGAADLTIACLPRFEGTAEAGVRVRLDAVKICAAEHAPEQAHVALDQAARIAQGEARLEALVVSEEVRVAALTGDIRRGRAAADRALDRADLSDAGVVCEAAELFAASLDPAAARAALVRAEELVGDDDPEGRALIEAKRARVDLALGDAHAALRTSRIAADLARGVEATALFAEAKLALGEASTTLGGRDRAYAAFTSALEAAETSGDKRLETLARARLAHLEATSHPPRESGLLTLRGLARAAVASGSGRDTGTLRFLFAEALAHAGNASEARAELEALLALAKETGHRALETRASALLSR